MPKYIDSKKIVLKYEFGMISDEGIVCIPMRDVKKSIAATPAADVVEVVHGEWVKDTTFDLCGIDYYKCSVCGKEQQIEHPYCPNCGARMDGEKK